MILNSREYNADKTLSRLPHWQVISKIGIVNTNIVEVLERKISIVPNNKTTPSKIKEQLMYVYADCIPTQSKIINAILNGNYIS